MPSPFDKVTKSGELRNYLANRPFVEELAKSQEAVFDTEMKRLGLQEKQKEIAMKDEALQSMRDYDQNVTSQAANTEDLMRRTQDFIKKNPRNSAQIMEYAGKASSFFDAGNKSKKESIELEQLTRSNEMQKEFDELNKKAVKSKLEYEALQSSQNQTKLKLDEWKTQESQVDGVTSMFSAINNLQLNEESKTNMRNVANYYYKKINDYAGKEDSASKIEAQKYFDESSKIFAPLLEFDAINRTLRSSYSVKHSETQTKAEQQYRPQYLQWANKKNAEGVDPSALNFENFLIDSYESRFESGSIGSSMMQNKNEAEMLEDIGELSQAKKQFKSYNASMLESIDPVTGMPREDKIGNLVVESKSMSLLLNQSLNRSKLKSETTSKQLEQEKARLDNLRTQASIQDTTSRISDRKRRTEILAEDAKSLLNEKDRLERAIVNERSKESDPGGTNPKRSQLIKDLQGQLEKVETNLNTAKSNAALSSDTTDTITPVK
jgi:hypothetical protein